MDSSIYYRDRRETLHGISVVGRGVFTLEREYDHLKYAGQHKNRRTCGLGVFTWIGNSHFGPRSHIYAEYGPDGNYDGRCLERGDTSPPVTDYSLYERGEQKDHASVQCSEQPWFEGRYDYNGEACASDDPRLLALIAQVAPVEVCPAAPAPTPQSPPLDPKQVRCAGSFCTRRRSRPPWPLRCTPTPHAGPGGRATQANNSRNASRDRVVTRSRAGPT